MDYTIRSMLSLPSDSNLALDSLLKYKEGDIKERERVILYSIRLVYYIVRKYKNNPYLPEDLFSIGLIGLIRAVDTFNIERNSKFSTYACTCINNEILMFLRKSKKNEVEISLNTTFINKEKQIPLQDILIDDNINILLDYEERETKKELLEIIERLPENEKKVIKLFFGFNGRICAQREIAEVLNVSQSYTSRLIKKALQKIQIQLKMNQNRCEIFDGLTLKCDYQKAILLLQQDEYIELFSSFTTKQALILLLKLGFVDEKQYTDKFLAEFFKIEEKEIQEIYINFLKTKQKIYRK